MGRQMVELVTKMGKTGKKTDFCRDLVKMNCFVLRQIMLYSPGWLGTLHFPASVSRVHHHA
jgi:hypothetical protein